MYFSKLSRSRGKPPTSHSSPKIPKKPNSRADFLRRPIFPTFLLFLLLSPALDQIARATGPRLPEHPGRPLFLILRPRPQHAHRVLEAVRTRLPLEPKDLEPRAETRGSERPVSTPFALLGQADQILHHPLLHLLVTRIARSQTRIRVHLHENRPQVRRRKQIRSEQLELRPLRVQLGQGGRGGLQNGPDRVFAKESDFSGRKAHSQQFQYLRCIHLQVVDRHVRQLGRPRATPVGLRAEPAESESGEVNILSNKCEIYTEVELPAPDEQRVRHVLAHHPDPPVAVLVLRVLFF